MGLDFHGKNAIVTGGASGIGLATVRLLRESGANVHVIDRETDVTNRAALAAAMDAAGALDIVVANAGIGSEAAFLETSEELWSQTLAVNLTGAFHTVQLAGERMKGRRRGAIVLTASTNSYDGEPMLAAYNASKAGVLGLLHPAEVVPKVRWSRRSMAPARACISWRIASAREPRGNRVRSGRRRLRRRGDDPILQRPGRPLLERAARSAVSHHGVRLRRRPPNLSCHTVDS